MPLEQDTGPISDAVELLDNAKGVLGKVMHYEMPDHVLNSAIDLLELRILSKKTMRALEAVADKARQFEIDRLLKHIEMPDAGPSQAQVLAEPLTETMLEYRKVLAMKSHKCHDHLPDPCNILFGVAEQIHMKVHAQVANAMVKVTEAAQDFADSKDPDQSIKNIKAGMKSARNVLNLFDWSDLYPKKTEGETAQEQKKQTHFKLNSIEVGLRWLFGERLENNEAHIPVFIEWLDGAVEPKVPGDDSTEILAFRKTVAPFFANALAQT